MSSSAGPAPARLTLRELSANGRVLAALTLGFASGLPFNLPQSTLQAWLAEANLSLKAIGWFTLVAIPYWLKFLWAPLLDRFSPPLLGRRRGWILIFQMALAMGIAVLGMQSPGGALWPIAVVGLVVVFLSASQDIVIDAYRTDVLHPAERGLGSTATQLGYRAATYVSGALALVLSGFLGWRGTYLAMAVLMAATAAFTVIAPEPAHVERPRRLAEAVREPLKELLARPGVRWLLLFTFLYKFGDAFAIALWSAFLIKGVGFTAAQVGAVGKVTMIVALMLGTLTGGILFARLGLYWSLLVFGLLQSFSNLLYSLLAAVGRDLPTMVIAVGFDQFAAGLGAVALGAFIMAMCDTRYSAFQFALLSSIAAIPRSVLGPLAGALVEGGQIGVRIGGHSLFSLPLPALGWERFFFVTTFAGLPAIGLLWLLRSQVRALDRPASA
jgi:PAT family beta-lactamase induction signal transducer AmpG